MCLPGGKAESGDADDTATALREAYEEIGLPPAAVRIVPSPLSRRPVLSKHMLSVRDRYHPHMMNTCITLRKRRRVAAGTRDFA